jgi:hypothetical protein
MATSFETIKPSSTNSEINLPVFYTDYAQCSLTLWMSGYERCTMLGAGCY